jgi:hypothetical protein
VPYSLIGVLTIGAGLGVGLAFSEGPVTVNPANSSMSQALRCSTSVTHDGVSVSCNSPETEVSANSVEKGQSVTLWFRSAASIPKGFAACLGARLPPSEPINFPGSSPKTTLGDLKRGVLPKLPSIAALKKFERSSQARSQQKAFTSALTACGFTKDKH